MQIGNPNFDLIHGTQLVHVDGSTLKKKNMITPPPLVLQCVDPGGCELCVR